MPNPPTLCRHCGKRIEQWNGVLGPLWLHTDTGRTDCHPTTRAEPEDTDDAR